MKVAIITGSAGLIGSEAIRFFSKKMDIIVGIDNNIRSCFFGADASMTWNERQLGDQISNLSEIPVGRGLQRRRREVFDLSKFKSHYLDWNWQYDLNYYNRNFQVFD
jgi:NAD(P)-dependent dehydrogenase (short-subunit alcohol dehydrogenase family)